MRSFFCFCFVLCFLPFTGLKAQKTVVEVTDLANEVLRAKMSANTSEVVTEMNSAYLENRMPKFDTKLISQDAIDNIEQIWKNSPIRCVDSEIYTRCIKSGAGFQIRNLPFMVKADNGMQDVVLQFDAAGKIDAFYFALDRVSQNAILRGNQSVTDLRYRQMILDFVENFRTAYNRKDIDLISSMYSDYALIITGKVIKLGGEMTLKGLPKERVEYTKQSKAQYINNLKASFKRTAWINIGFESIQVMQHPKIGNIYGVTLMQNWRASNYSDDGWLFLAIEFFPDEHMEIHVRTWQPSMLNGQELSRDEVFGLGNFRF